MILETDLFWDFLLLFSVFKKLVLDFRLFFYCDPSALNFFC
jgi:hypothetical protein